MQRPDVRLHLFFASENDRAVILRQGPRRQFHMSLWFRDTGHFEDGQWLKHAVSPEWCDLSPDGRHFLYYTLDGKWQSPTGGSYTALSRPPYFTALALFPVGDKWAGGGRFLNNHFYTAVGDKDVIGQLTETERLFQGEPDAKCPTGLRTKTGACAKVSKTCAARLQQVHPVSHAWPDGQYSTEGGALYRGTGPERVLIRDFTEMRFEPVRAPYDWRDPETNDRDGGWHPLDGGPI